MLKQNLIYTYRTRHTKHNRVKPQFTLGFFFSVHNSVEMSKTGFFCTGTMLRISHGEQAYIVHRQAFPV
jgi:hypothetical protein